MDGPMYVSVLACGYLCVLISQSHFHVSHLCSLK